MVCTGPHAVDIPVFAISANIFVITSFPERSEIITRGSVNTYSGLELSKEWQINKTNQSKHYDQISRSLD